MLHLILKVLICLIVLYLAMGLVPYSMSILHGDYPGPKELYSNFNLTKNTGVDYLLIHGASVDARVWSNLLKRNSDKSMVAISLSNHENGVTQANPITASTDLLNYLKTNRVNKAIITHSTGSLWIADTYNQHPEYFKHLKIILLAPSFGTNINHGDLNTLHFLNKFALILPRPMLNLGGVSSCYGNEAEYKYCKEIYTYKRLFLFNSLKYYNNVVAYSFAARTQSNLEKFLKKDQANITMYIASNDHVLDKDKTIKTAEKYGIKYVVIPNTSHCLLADKDNLWLK